MDDPNRRYIGIVGDGGTDRAVLAHTARICIGEGCEIVELRRQKLRDSIDEYWQLQRDGEDGDTADQVVVKAVVGVLVAALSDFESRIPRVLDSSDLLVLSTDAERYINNEIHYFERWAWRLIAAAYLGIEKFVQAQIVLGRSCELIPEVSLFIPFPSTEVFVAAIREEKECRGVRALELKQRLYGTTNLNELGTDAFKELALDFIEKDSLKQAFKTVPEVRDVLTTLRACR